ncbi:MAG: hypothetical protein ACKVOR_10650 [Flavobacteriales bacterium]
MKKNLLLLFVLIVLAVVSFIIWKQNTNSTLANKPLSDFTIEDTARVNKIVISDMQGGRAVLERIPGNTLWLLNGKYFARKDATDLLLKTMNRIRVRGNVSEKGRDNMMKLLITSSKKVEIYMGENEPAKIYYVGNATEDHTGTMMLLEIPGIGRSEDPYITHMEGFTGFLTTRFFTSEMEWRYTGIFEYPALDINRVRMINHNNTNYSFEVNYTGGNNISMNTGYIADNNTFSLPVKTFDTLAVKDFLLKFKKAHVESYNTLLRPEAMDSLRNTKPAFTIYVRENSGTEKHIDLYLKRASKLTYDEAGNPFPWDRDYFYARTDADEFAMAQMYTFEPMVQPFDYYAGSR